MEAVNTKAYTFKVGDLVKVTTRDPADSKVKLIPFEGMVIALRGEGANITFTVRKLAADKVAVERIFPLASPYIQGILVVKETRLRRAKLYYLRGKN